MSLLQHIFLETKTVTKISVGKMSVYNIPKHNWQSFPFFERIIIRVVACLVSKTNYFGSFIHVSVYIYLYFLGERGECRRFLLSVATERR